ncbi:DUF2267 domain-containing protein [Candidatus Saccharibacteria bacterium]|nr:MAG: DUF2267 domain-containing protein [Candidatus Saccharibacteria bacterium]
MKYYDLIRRVKDSAGAEDEESQDALELVVENVAVHLTDPTRKEFAAALPSELQHAAQMVPTASHLDEDIVSQLMDLEDVEEHEAKNYIRAAWQAIKDIFGDREVDEIKSELPHNMVAVLE